MTPPFDLAAALAAARRGRPARPARPPDGDGWYVVEALDGEFPRVVRCQSPAALAERVARLDGTDAVVVPFYGRRVLMSADLPRVLYLPDAATGWLVPPPGRPSRQVPVDPDALVPSDGHLAPPPPPVPSYPPPTGAGTDPPPDPDPEGEPAR